MDTNQNTRNLKDFEVNIRIKLAFLWTAVTLCYLYGDYFELYIPGKTAGLASGDNLLNSPMKLLSAAVLLALPPLMILLSIFLKPKINRFLNILFGIFFTLIMLLIATSSLTTWKSFYVFLALFESIITTIIVILAWKWPKAN
ncbi:DUF6326 family protein [Flavobacterium collinsii]|uniref:Uncharacterized protein n=1 Tax=Flavobacterium collinsii TaxID=1114861 RepID=A0A9W4TJ08_9FLAO|nr:DUF6326 family protein [Flavobacterium collinsii]GIQ61080.1 hypothetical protein Flavo103_42150 [Flavobacterium collinsii]CAI2768458.1 conserved membrane protein of unknown function [Flavobacterium collinsii]